MTDTTLPSLTGLTISLTTVDLSNGPVMITFTGTATDNVGIADLSIDFNSNGGFNFLGGSTSIGGFPDSWADGQSSSAETVAVNTHDGTYTIADLVLFDTSGNQRAYTAAQLQQMGIQTSVTVTGADNSGPALTALSMPNSVAAGHNLTISASATDRSGIQYVVVDFDKNLTPSGTSFDLFGNTDSWADGSSASSVTVPAGTPNGVYTIQDVKLTDTLGNVTTLSTSQLAAAGYQTTITVSDTDTTPPALTALTFPPTIDLSTGDKNVTFQASATDDASGVQEVVVHFDRDFLTGTNGVGLVDITGGNGDSWTDGTSHVTDTVAHTAPSSGVYNITSVDVTDGAANTATYTPAQLAAMGIATSLTVIPGQQAPTDTTPPTLDGVTFPSGIDVSQGNGAFPLTVTAHDDSSGVADVIVWLDNNIELSTGLTSGFDLNGSNDSWSDGSSGGTWFITNAATPGVYAIDHIDLHDVAGNTITYSSSQLDALGISWGFFVYDSSFGVSANNVFSGTLGDDVLQGNAGSSILFGGAGNDQLIGIGGHDWFYGGSGNDTYVVVSIYDIVVEYASQGTDLVETTLSSYTLTDDVENLSFTGSGSFAGYGNALDNIIIGGSGDDLFEGYGGNDTLQGGLGFDIAIYSGVRASYTIAHSGLATTVSGPDGTDTLTGIEKLEFSDTSVSLTSAASDFSGDGMSDVLFIQPGVNFDSDYEWQMNDRSISAYGGVDLFDKAFTVQVTGDFNGDGKADVLFENPTTAGVWEWELNGKDISDQGAVDVGDPSFHILGTADFNADGTSDLLWRSTAGFLYEWQMNGTSDTGAAIGALDLSWHAVGAGDFNGDGKADILFHYQNSANAADPANGAFDIWQMNGSTVVATLGVERPDASWQILGVGDFNGDGISDIAIRNVSNTGDNGAVWVYLMAGTITSHGDGSQTADILAQGPAGIADAATWHVQEIGDLSGDGKADILFRNDAGYFYSWDMNGTTISSEGAAGTESGNWADPSLHVIGQHWEIA